MSPPWMPFYVADYLADTRRLSTLEHGAYVLLIMEYWLHGALPTEDAQLARVAMMPEKQWAKVRPTIAAFFTEGWKHARIERELAKSVEKNTRRVEAGKAGGFKKHKSSKQGSIARSNGTNNALASSSQPQLEDTSLRSVSPQTARKPKSTKTPIAEDFQPGPIERDHSVSIGMSPEVFRFEWQRYRDHHLKCGSKFASWPAAWRTWCANWLERGGAKHARAGPRAPASDGISSMLRRIDEAQLDQRSDHTPSDRKAHSANASAAHGDDAFSGRDGFGGPQFDLEAFGAERY